MISDFYTIEEMAGKFNYEDVKSVRESLSRGTFPFTGVKLGNQTVFPKKLVNLQLDLAIKEQTDFNVELPNKIRRQSHA